MQKNHKILALDAGGNPHEWMSVEDAVFQYVKGHVAWEAGVTETAVLGGINRASGQRTVIEVNSIIALRDARYQGRIMAVNRDALFQRDRWTCAYCGDRFRVSQLEAEHVIPDSAGGPYSWTNLVTACHSCNQKKADRTPEQAGMPLLYVPYVPNVFESFILAGRNVLADQMDFLLSGVPKQSRLI